MRARKLTVFLAAVVAVTLLAACTPGLSGSKPKKASPPPKTETVTIKITDKGFVPLETKIKARGRVIWVNEGKKSHNIYFDAEQSSSGNIPPGARASHIFNQLGIFTYHDPLNPKKAAFKGKITVY